ncbi:MAG TPA: hypothetical protein VLZ83_01200 [Edaphocola sp.]|nr:hypothetical protein [Edaphocola sp.]
MASYLWPSGVIKITLPLLLWVSLLASGTSVPLSVTQILPLPSVSTPMTPTSPEVIVLISNTGTCALSSSSSLHRVKTNSRTIKKIIVINLVGTE